LLVTAPLAGAGAAAAGAGSLLTACVTAGEGVSASLPHPLSAIATAQPATAGASALIALEKEWLVFINPAPEQIGRSPG
jgi:hypothetical protein